jgi:hypothetical protein
MVTFGRCQKIDARHGATIRIGLPSAHAAPNSISAPQ